MRMVLAVGKGQGQVLRKSSRRREMDRTTGGRREGRKEEKLWSTMHDNTQSEGGRRSRTTDQGRTTASDRQAC